MSTQNDKSKLLSSIINLDKRWVYLFLFLAITLPFFLKPIITMKTTPWVQKAHDIVQKAADVNKPIMISFDYDPSTMAELQPMAEAFLRHAFSNNIKVVGITFMINGVSLAADTMDRIAKEYGKEYGKDYVFFGYLPQISIVLLNWGDNFRKDYKTDFRGLNVETLPMLKNIQNYNDFHAVIDITGTKIASMFIVYGVDKFKFNYIAGVTAVSATEYFPYLQTGQMKGFLAGMKSAAEYEGILEKPAAAMRGMASQSWGHMIIILFIIIGNILYYMKKRLDEKQQ